MGHNSAFLQGPAFSPPRIREAIWGGSTNSAPESLSDERLMPTTSDAVKLVMADAPLSPPVLGGDHSISFPVVRAVSEYLDGQVDILHLDDIYHQFEGNYYPYASSFTRIMEGGYARRLLQVGVLSIIKEGRQRQSSLERTHLKCEHLAKAKRLERLVSLSTLVKSRSGGGN